jgi:CheY-like chemotaxis protein
MRAVGAPPCALVVEDEPLARDVLARALRGLGLQALTAASAAEALEACRLGAGRLALALVDLGAPAPGGFAALDALRGLAPPVPVLLVAGAADLLAAEGLLAGAAGVLAKPVRPAELKRAVRALLPGLSATRRPPRAPRRRARPGGTA